MGVKKKYDIHLALSDTPAMDGKKIARVAQTNRGHSAWAQKAVNSRFLYLYLDNL